MAGVFRDNVLQAGRLRQHAPFGAKQRDRVLLPGDLGLQPGDLIGGDLGLSPGSAVVGFPPGLVNGKSG